MNYKVIDKSRFPNNNLFKMVFVRNENNKKLVSLPKWIKLTIFEVIFGSELLENIVNSSTGASTREDQCQYGKEMKLNSFVPSGLFTNITRGVLVEVLYYKFYKQYYILRPCQLIEGGDVDSKAKIIDCSLIRFASFKEIISQFISLRRVYELNHLIVNLSVDTMVYLYTNRLDFAILSAIVVESIRRIVKT